MCVCWSWSLIERFLVSECSLHWCAAFYCDFCFTIGEFRKCMVFSGHYYLKVKACIRCIPKVGFHSPFYVLLACLNLWVLRHFCGERKRAARRPAVISFKPKVCLALPLYLWGLKPHIAPCERWWWFSVVRRRNTLTKSRLSVRALFVGVGITRGGGRNLVRIYDGAKCS